MSQGSGKRPPGGTVSGEQYRYHFKHYFRAHELKLREIRARLLKADTHCPDPVFSFLRVLKGEELWLRNSVILHENYFNCLDGEKAGPSSELLALLSRDFGSVEEWEADFKAQALSARGWVVLGFDLWEGRLVNIISDEHAGAPWMIYPLLSLDIFEHAYQRDYGTEKEAYLKNFLRYINWETVNECLDGAQKMYRSVKKE